MDNNQINEAITTQYFELKALCNKQELQLLQLDQQYLLLANTCRELIKLKGSESLNNLEVLLDEQVQFRLKLWGIPE